MSVCRLKIITVNISPDPQNSDSEEIKYISQCNNSLFGNIINNNNEGEKEKNILRSAKKHSEEEKNMEQNEENEEEEVIIIRDKNDLLKKNKNKIISKEKIYLIDGLFSSTNMTSTNNNKKFKSVKNSTSNLNIMNNLLKSKSKNKKKGHSYKFETNANNFDNKINTFYDSKQIINTNIKKEENPFAFSSYKINKEINSNISGLYDYKGKIKELLKEEPKIIENRENIFKENKGKIDNLLKENNKLNYELGFEINREDELKGEIIILNNQNKILINELNNIEKKIQEYKEIIKHKSNHEKIISNKQTEILNYYNNLNECLTKGDILLVTKPDINNNNHFTYLNSKNQEINEIYKKNTYDDENKDNKISVKLELANENINLDLTPKKDDNSEINNFLNNDIITFILKGYFINMNITNVDVAVNKLWLKEKPIQIFETLVEELLILIDNYIIDYNATFINEYNRNILMNYFYSFCNCYNYMTINEFKSIFHDKLGNFIVNNDNNNFFIKNLYKYCNTKLSDLILLMKNLDIDKKGKINLHEFIKGLKEKNLFLNLRNNYNNINSIDNNNNKENINIILLEQNELYNMIQLLIIYMKKNPIKNLSNNTQQNSSKKENYNYNKNNKDNNTNTNTNSKKDEGEINNNNIAINNKKNLSIYDLYYEPVINLIYENKNTEIALYKGIVKKYLIDNNYNSLQDFLEPLLSKSDIIINKGLNHYLKAQTFIDFLDTNNVIKKSEKFLLPYEDDDLLDINNLVKIFDEANPLILNNFEDNKDIILNDIINSINDN